MYSDSAWDSSHTVVQFTNFIIQITKLLTLSHLQSDPRVGRNLEEQIWIINKYNDKVISLQGGQKWTNLKRTA